MKLSHFTSRLYLLAAMFWTVPVGASLAWNIQHHSTAVFLLGSAHGALWLFGLLGLGLTLRSAASRETELRASEKRFRDLFDNSPDPCWLIRGHDFIDCNRAALAALGYADRAELMRHPSRLSPERQPDGQPSFEKAEAMMRLALENGVHRFDWEHRRADGGTFPVEVTLARIEMPDGEMLYCVWRDISERRAAEEAARNLAFFDPVTQLPNRRLLLDRLQQSMAASARSGKHRALLFLDLDHFKKLNDTHGHAAGDRLLIEAALRLRGCVRESDTVARVGGDEFVVLLEQLSSDPEEARMQAGAVGEMIIERLGNPYGFTADTYHGTTSLGIAVFVGQEAGVEELIKRADLAMYQAKAAGRNTLRFFEPALQAHIVDHAALESELRHAVEQHEFVLHYQPQIEGGGDCIGVEALVRWNNPKRGLMQPMEFIPLAEETGLILGIGKWVLREACTRLREWRHDPALADLSIAVNVSPRQFHDPAFVDDVRGLLHEFQVNPGLLKIEITESTLVQDMDEVVAKMQELKSVGISFALDDFGTGYSSLTYVKRLPIAQLKIDKSFVRDLLADQNDAAICRAIIALGDSLGLHTIAEGVETARQWKFLSEAGCGGTQGFLYAKPMPAGEFQAWLRRRAARQA